MDPHADEPRPPRDLLDPRGWLAATVVALGLLAATGLWQAEHYRPTARQAWGDLAAMSWDDIRVLHTGVETELTVGDPTAERRQGQGWVSDAHRGFATTFLVLGAVFVACLLRWAWRKVGGDAIAVVAVLVGVGAAASAPASGRGLLWDNLALWAVTADNTSGGIWPAAFGDQVRFVLMGRLELSQGTFRGEVIEHVVVVPALLVVAALVLGWRLRRR